MLAAHSIGVVVLAGLNRAKEEFATEEGKSIIETMGY